MKTAMKRMWGLALLPVCLLLAWQLDVSAADTAPLEWKASNVVIVVMDGARWVDTWGDPKHENVPVLASNMAPRGVIAAKMRNRGMTVTNPSHAALVTGFYESIDNSSELPGHPTLLQRFLAASGLPREKAWLVTAKDKLKILANCKDPEWKGKFQTATYCGKNGAGMEYEEDPVIAAKVIAVLTNDHPRLVVVNFRSSDSAGHSGKRDAYLAAIHLIDSLVGNIFSVLETDPFYKDRTAFFLTNDHGRHSDGVADGFQGHGCDCDGCRRILLFAAGPDFARGAVVAEPVETIDVPVTAAAILGFTIPDSKGKLLTCLRPEFVENIKTNAATPVAPPSGGPKP